MSRTGFRLLDPAKTMRQRLDFVRQLHDREALLPRERQRRFLEAEGWVAWPGPALADVIRQFGVHNRLVSGGFVIEDRLVTLADMTCPILAFVGETDEIAPAKSVRAARWAAPRSEVYEVTLPAGHFGLVVGSTAVETTWPTVAAWAHWRADDGDASRGHPAGRGGGRAPRRRDQRPGPPRGLGPARARGRDRDRAGARRRRHRRDPDAARGDRRPGEPARAAQPARQPQPGNADLARAAARRARRGGARGRRPALRGPRPHAGGGQAPDRQRRPRAARDRRPPGRARRRPHADAAERADRGRGAEPARRRRGPDAPRRRSRHRGRARPRPPDHRRPPERRGGAGRDRASRSTCSAAAARTASSRAG